MIVASPGNPTPKVGQILYSEDRSSDGKFEFARLVFVDEEIKEGQPWMYTQIADMEDFGEGLQVYAGIEAGSMPPKYTRLATDSDLKKFIDLLKAGKVTKDSPTFDQWLEDVKKDEILLPEEKERIAKISNSWN